MQREFEEWVETLEKGLKVLEVFSEFESRFGRFFLRHEAILALDKVFMFLCVVDVREYF